MLQSDSGPAKSVPASYRIGLALSFALLSHILLLAGLAFPSLETQDFSHRLVFTLSSPNSPPSVQSTPAPSEQQPLRHTEFSVAPHREQPPQSTVRTEQTKTSNASKRQDALQQPSNTRAVTAETATAQSSQLNTSRHESGETIQRITRSTSEQDPYLIKLAVHLAEELQKLRVPAISQLNETKEMTLELRILANGALTRAQVKETTGIANIDRAAYRAALSASPYPKPVGETSDRFDVKLVFTPKRPER
ncbi:energy transducer TonB [Marinobacter litoralis]|uniref:energy transducer TonB family protein n=1 Tax=Marinobacter litoralis TaxID=187981 RepID=UPI0018EC200A|nr:TonB family protein [Marinobacter litoralis]MBJ6138303.1 TonB family protein [Marinobacter litoralis]